jgi:alcohol dehydrogenase YqhD (iron-dependent ADH family)
VDPTGKSELEVAHEGIQCTREFFNEIGAPATLTDLEIPESAIDDLAARTDLSCWAYKELTREDVKAILRMAL